MERQDLEQLADLVAERMRTTAAPAPAVKRERGKRKAEVVPDYLTEEEVGRLLGAIEDVRDRAIFTIVYYRGLRASEPGELTLDDYQPSAGRLTVHRLKGSRGGEYRLFEEERQALKAWLRRRGTEPGPLFLSRNGGPITRWRIFHLMKRYCALAGIPAEKAHPHALKHSCGTHLSEKEPDILAIQDHLGHKDIRNTMGYIRITSRRRSELADRIEKTGWGKAKKK